MHIRNEYLHPTANSGRVQAEQMCLAPQGSHHSYADGYEPYLLQGSDGATYAMNPGDWSWWPFASAANASFSAANARYAPICLGNPYIEPDAHYQHAVAPAFVQYLPQYAEFYAPRAVAAAPEMVRAPRESNRTAHESYQAAQSAQRSMSGADSLKAPKPKRPDDDVPNIVVEDCDTGDARPPGSGSATSSSDSTHLHPHWHERSAGPSDGSLATNPSNGAPATNSSEGPRLQVHPRILAIKSISCHCTPRAPISTAGLPAESPTAHPSFPSSTSAAPIQTADHGQTAPTARPVSSPPIMAAAIVHMFPFSPLVPKVPLVSAGSPGAPAGSFKTRLPPGFVPGVLSPWVVDGRGLSLQSSPAEGAASLAAGDSKLTLNNEPLPPYSPAPSMGSVTSHWDGERLVSADWDGEWLASDPWGHEGAVRRWVEELDEFCRTERCATKARWPTLAEVGKVKGDEAAKANDAGKAKVDHAETVQLDDHTNFLDHIPWPILRDPESPALDNPRSSSLSTAHNAEVAPRDTVSASPDLAHSITPLAVNLFFRAARRVTLNDHAARQVTLNDHAAHCHTYNNQPRTPSYHTARPITPHDCAWRALLRKSHRAFKRAREVVKGRLEQITRPAGSEGKSVHWKDNVKGAKMKSAGDDEVVVYLTGGNNGAKDGRDDKTKDAKHRKLEEARRRKLEDTLRAINVVLQTLDVLRRLDGY